MANMVADIFNQALDAMGSEKVIGDPEEGTKEAQVLLRAYRQCLMQYLRSANWDFARKTAPLVLLADATGQTANVDNLVPEPWVYAYQYPIDCMKVRFVPHHQGQLGSDIPPGNIQIAPVPQTTGETASRRIGRRMIPSRFVIATDFNHPPLMGQITWEVQGVSPQGRTVVLSNAKNAHVVYTALMLYPSVWDSLFRGGLVSYLASECCLAIMDDKKYAMGVRSQLIQTAKQKLVEARLVDGNEGTYSSDIRVDWMDARRVGGSFGRFSRWDSGDGPGVLGYGWDSCSFSDGTAF